MRDEKLFSTERRSVEAPYNLFMEAPTESRAYHGQAIL